jgi:hypothetical protein
LIVETAWLTRIYVLFFISLWARCDFGPDGTPPSATGIAKVGHALLTFFLNSLYTRCWFGA